MSVLGISVTPTAIHAVALERGQPSWAAACEYRGLPDLVDAIARLAAERPRDVRRARIAVSGTLAPLRIIDLPTMSATELDDYVLLSVKQLFPGNGVRKSIGAVRLARRNGQCTAAIAASGEDLLESLRSGCQAASLQILWTAPASIVLLDHLGSALQATEALGDPGFVVAVAAALTRSPMLRLRGHGATDAAELRQRRSITRSTLAAILATLLAVASYGLALQRTERRATVEMTELAPALRRVDALRRDMRQAQVALEFFDRGTGRRTGVSRTLAAIARTLPDSSFLTSLRRRPDGSLLLTGYSPRSGVLLRAIEQSTWGRGARIEGSISREAVAGRELERFTLTIPPGSRP